MTSRVSAKVVLALLQGDQEFLQQDPDSWCLGRVLRGIHPEVGDPCGELLQGSKAVLEQFQGDGGSGQWGHRLDATASRVPAELRLELCEKRIGINPPKREEKPRHCRQTDERRSIPKMSENHLPDLPPLSNADGGESTKAVGNGPFGLSKGLRKEDLDIQMMEVKPCFYKAETLPKKHSAFQYYFLQITPVQGLSWIKAIGNSVSTNSYGTEIQNTFETMRGKLENIYGRPENIDFLMYDSIWNEPRDWMQAIQNGERTLAARWENKNGMSLPSDLTSIFLYVAAEDSYTGYIAIEYAFANFDASEKEIGMLEDDAL